MTGPGHPATAEWKQGSAGDAVSPAKETPCAILRIKISSISSPVAFASRLFGPTRDAGDAVEVSVLRRPVLRAGRRQGAQHALPHAARHVPQPAVGGGLPAGPAGQRNQRDVTLRDSSSLSSWVSLAYSRGIGAWTAAACTTCLLDRKESVPTWCWVDGYPACRPDEQRTAKPRNYNVHPSAPGPPHLLTSGLKALSGGRSSVCSAHSSWWQNRSSAAAVAARKSAMAPSRSRRRAWRAGRHSTKNVVQNRS